MNCPECGARIPKGFERCELCGWELEPGQELEGEDAPVSLPSLVDDLVCVACGRVNRPDALFCDQCATPLAPAGGDGAVGTPATKPAASVPVRAKPLPDAVESGSEEPKQRVGLLLIGGIVAVVALYGITLLSKSRTVPPVSDTQSTVSNSDLDAFLPADPGLEARADEIRASVAAASDPARRLALRTELMQWYAGNGRLDLAGREQQLLAEEDGSAGAWTLAGNLHFDWMEQQSGDERVKAAKRSIAAYKRSLEIQPDDLDVRTDLGVAYLNEPGSPMLAIQETNAVLEADSTHLQANFNKGVMLLQIGRTDEAIQHFQRVRDLSDVESGPHQRAVEVLQQLEAAE